MAILTSLRSKNVAWTVVALLCLSAELGGSVTASIILRNASDKAVTVSADSSDPLEGTVVQPGCTITFSPAAYYLSNVKIVQAELEIDYQLYVIKNAITTVGLVQLYEVVGDTGTVSFVGNAVPITGEF